MTDELEIEGYASLFWTRDLNEDVTAAGAFAASLARTGAGGVKMLYQHEAGEPVGVWDEVVEDARGLFVRGRILTVSPQGRLAAALVKAGALDGLLRGGGEADVALDGVDFREAARAVAAAFEAAG